MFKCKLSQHRSSSLPGSNTGIQYKSCVNVIMCRLAAFMLLFLKDLIVFCTAGSNLSALNGYAHWRQQQTDCSGESTSDLEHRLSTTGRPGRRHSIKHHQCASPGDYRALICHEQLIWNPAGGRATGRVWWSEVEGLWNRKREREERWRVNEWARAAVPTKSILLDSGCGHSSLYHCATWGLAAKL